MRGDSPQPLLLHNQTRCSRHTFGRKLIAHYQLLTPSAKVGALSEGEGCADPTEVGRIPESKAIGASGFCGTKTPLAIYTHRMGIHPRPHSAATPTSFPFPLPFQQRNTESGQGGTTPSLHGRYTRLARFDFVTESKATSRYIHNKTQKYIF